MEQHSAFRKISAAIGIIGILLAVAFVIWGYEMYLDDKDKHSGGFFDFDFLVLAIGDAIGIILMMSMGTIGMLLDSIATRAKGKRSKYIVWCVLNLSIFPTASSLLPRDDEPLFLLFIATLVSSCTLGIFACMKHSDRTTTARTSLWVNAFCLIGVIPLCILALAQIF